MNGTLRFAVVSVLGLGGLLSAAGCKVTVQSETRYNGTAVPQDAAWTSGKSVIVNSDNGDVSVVADAAATTVHVVAKPFAFDTEEASAKSTMNGKLSFTVSNDANGNIVFDASQSGSGSYGFDLEVHLPPSFDAMIDVEQHNGSVDIAGAGAATQTKVISGNGSITAKGISHTVYLSTQNGSVDVTALPSDGAANNLIHTDNGFVTYTVPAGGNLTIAAKTQNGQVIVPNPTPTGWTIAGASPDATITIGDGTTKVEVSTGNGDVDLYAQ